MEIYSDTCFHLNRLSALKNLQERRITHSPPKKLPILHILQLANRETDGRTDGQMDEWTDGQTDDR